MAEVGTVSFRDWVRSWLGVTDEGVQGEPGEPGGTIDDTALAALTERVAWLEANAVTHTTR